MKKQCRPTLINFLLKLSQFFCKLQQTQLFHKADPYLLQRVFFAK